MDTIRVQKSFFPFLGEKMLLGLARLRVSIQLHWGSQLIELETYVIVEKRYIAHMLMAISDKTGIPKEALHPLGPCTTFPHCSYIVDSHSPFGRALRVLGHVVESGDFNGLFNCITPYTLQGQRFVQVLPYMTLVTSVSNAWRMFHRKEDAPIPRPASMAECRQLVQYLHTALAECCKRGHESLIQGLVQVKNLFLTRINGFRCF